MTALPPFYRAFTRAGRALAVAAAVLTVRLDASLADARVVTDEIVTTSPVWNSGASPMWCMGAPLLVRRDGEVWASIAVRDPDVPAYCNNHWELWRRPAAGRWKKVNQGPPASEREPCPLFLLDPKSLVVSIQPKLLAQNKDATGDTWWYCQPALAVFEPDRPTRDPKLWMPVFTPGAPFTQHSYRSMGVDPERGEFLLMVLDHEDVYHPTWRDAAGTWHPMTAPVFPIRACYPNIVLQNRSAHVLAIGDIVEPNAEWKAEKFRVLKRQWDYAFRRLFYAWTPNVAAGAFCPALEVDSVEATGGWMFNLDLHVDAQQRVHLLWVKRTFDHELLRDRFFPGQANVETVMHAVLEQGQIVAREILMQRELPAGDKARQNTSGRFHVLPDGRLLAVLVCPGATGGTGLFLQELDPQAKSSLPAVQVRLARPPPPGMFFTNTPRGGSAPSSDLDLLCTETGDNFLNLRYLHVHLP